MHHFRLQAQRELLEATQWYLDDAGPAVAEQFEWAVQRALRLLTVTPRLGRASYPGVRTWPLKHFPYTLVYRVKGEVISVVAVAHQSRAPGYLGRTVGCVSQADEAASWSESRDDLWRQSVEIAPSH